MNSEKLLVFKYSIIMITQQIQNGVSDIRTSNSMIAETFTVKRCSPQMKADNRQCTGLNN